MSFWRGFVAEGRKALAEPDNPKHRVRVEYDKDRVFVHLSGEDGPGWTTMAVHRATRNASIGQGRTQTEAAEAASRGLTAILSGESARSPE